LRVTCCTCPFKYILDQKPRRQLFCLPVQGGSAAPQETEGMWFIPYSEIEKL
jgi:hypothetical protein